jgi:hypothetical protein
MKQIDNRKTDNHKIREQSTIYGDSIKLISYPTFLLITWNIVSSTRKFLEHILQEEYEDLLRRIVLYRSSSQQQMMDFQIRESSGILRLDYIPTGIYYCELVTSNSHNEEITVKRSNTLSYLQVKQDISEEYHWKQTSLDHQSWLQSFSGYTIYE